MNIGLVGSGIIGLTTAVGLQEAGYSVTIYTKAFSAQTTSAKAGAIWFPYHAGPLDKVNEWAGASYKMLETHAGILHSGVYMVPFLVLSAPGINNDWTMQLPSSAIRMANAAELPAGFGLGYVATVPLVEPPAYLPFLVKQFIENGGVLKQQSFTTIVELAALAGIVINCTGLGAKTLCDDPELYPISGQILKVRSQNLPSMVNPTEPGRLSYVIQRSDCTILGGTDHENDYNEIPSPQDTTLIINRLLKLEALPLQPDIIEEVVALRPKRSSIRCEWDAQYPNIFHNYGHGGAGYTTAWGCAEEVVKNVATAGNFIH